MSLLAQIIYHDAAQFPLLGKVSSETGARYERLPDSIREKTRPPVWALGKNTAGLALRFRSNSTQIAAKWVLYEDRIMNHMTPTGIKGLDLYCLEKDEWVFVNSGRPSGRENEALIVSNMEGKEREFMLFLPLYDGITALEIGVDSTAFIGQPLVQLPVRTKPVVCYGTSILQGGCASRAGMAHTNILSRWLNREFINLGFSGHGQLDYEIAELMTGSDASLFVLDFMPNVDVEQIQEKTAKFYAILRSKSPDVPILFVENPIFPQSKYDLDMHLVIMNKNRALREVFNQLKKDGAENIWLIASEDMIGKDNEATVDGIHFTDLGFMRYAKYLYPIITKILDK